MSNLVHLICERCWFASNFGNEIEMTDLRVGRLCCYCNQMVHLSAVVHRHPDAVPCQGRHEKENS